MADLRTRYLGVDVELRELVPQQAAYGPWERGRSAHGTGRWHGDTADE
jgi:hypothetical protein